MYERFTDRARKVMQLANQEAQRFNHEYIGTEHLLLGLVKEGSGVAANVLKNLNVDLRKVRSEAEKLAQSGPEMVTLGRLPQTPRAKRVIELAMEEARHLRHNYVGTEHILLGLLREEKGVAAQVLMNLGLNLEAVRGEVLSLLGRPHGTASNPPSPPLPAQGSAPAAAGQAELPKSCPRCGHAPVARTIWGYGALADADLEDISTGKAILGSAFGRGGPRWVCLRCAPGWSQIHKLAMQEYRLQTEKEEAVARADFERAARCRDAQMEIRRQLATLEQLEQSR
jgi:hypothetical protein